jgi:hypothetical protein
VQAESSSSKLVARRDGTDLDRLDAAWPREPEASQGRSDALLRDPLGTEQYAWLVHRGHLKLRSSSDARRTYRIRATQEKRRSEDGV